MNIMYDMVIHAKRDDGLPVCGDASITVTMPEPTDHDVTCWECKAITE